MQKHLYLSPNTYNPNTNFNQDQIFHKTAHCVFGKQKVDILDEKWQKRELKQVPGPGAYQRFSDFGQTMS